MRRAEFDGPCIGEESSLRGSNPHGGSLGGLCLPGFDTWKIVQSPARKLLAMSLSRDRLGGQPHVMAAWERWLGAVHKATNSLLDLQGGGQ